VTSSLDGLIGARPVAALWQGARLHAPLVEAFVATLEPTRAPVAGRELRDAQAA
jgi:hypothetical protein